MELKPEYKQAAMRQFPKGDTRLERFDDEWTFRRLGDHVTFLTHGTNSRAELRRDGPVKYLHYGDIHACTLAMLEPSSLPSLPEEKAKGLDRLRDGDLVFADASEDLTGVSKSVEICGMGNTELVAGLHTIAARFDKDVLADGFKAYLQFCPVFTNQLRRLVAGTKVYATNRSHIASVEMCLPSIDEQRAIAAVFHDMDALLKGLDRLIAKKRDLKQATIQQLLTGRVRLRGFSGEWEIIRMGCIGSIYGGLSGKNKVDFGIGGARYVTFMGIMNNTVIDVNHTDHVYIASGESQNLVLKGDLLFNGTSETPDELAMGAVMEEHIDNLYLNSFCFGLRLHDEERYVPLFLAYFFRGPAGRAIVNTLSQGATRYNISKRQFSALKLSVPAYEEQQAIATILSDIDAEIFALEHCRNKTCAIKKGMIQALLTGKTRLVDPQASNEQTDATSGNAKRHNWAINEAVVIATLVKHFGGEDYPLGRKRYTKLSYLLHRHVEREADGYLKKAAGPYNPQTKYGGPEKIAKQNGYITQHKGPKGHSGFIAADNIAQAEGYFEKWYGSEVIQWLEQFRYKKNDDLEVLATVDMAALELQASGKSVTVAAVKDMITSHPEWEAKLDRAVFSDTNIAEAIKRSDALLGGAEIARDSHV